MTEFKPSAILLMRFTETELDDALEFNSGNQETNDFLKNEAFGEQERGLSTTTLVYYNGILAAFLSMCCDAIPLNKEEEGAAAALTVPAIKIRYGIDRKFKDYEGFEAFVIDYAKNVAFELWTSKVGVRYLTLDADLSQEHYFTEKGFIRNRSNDADGMISMRMDIFE